MRRPFHMKQKAFFSYLRAIIWWKNEKYQTQALKYIFLIFFSNLQVSIYLWIMVGKEGPSISLKVESTIVVYNQRV